MGNAASRVAVVDVFLVRAQVGTRRGTEAILLHKELLSLKVDLEILPEVHL